MIEDKNCELLFQYLYSILYDPKIEELDVQQLDAPFVKLGLGMQYLAQAVREIKTYSADLANGNLSGMYPGRENFLCENLKNLHANLNHLTWQAKQVAKGDYSQHVSYLGEFSEAFNSMTEQLREREQLLKAEAENAVRRAELVDHYNELFINLTRRINERILVTDAIGERILFTNHMEAEAFDDTIPELFRKQMKEQLKLLRQEHCSKRIWEFRDEESHIYRVTSLRMEWRGEDAMAHIVQDVTADTRKKEELERQAYFDPMTGVGNRRFFREKMERLLRENEPFAFCFFDLDHLKHINDTYGHEEGDLYIKRFVKAVRCNIRGNDVFARIGGDEFAAAFIGCSEQNVERKIKVIRDVYRKMDAVPYEADFSYGIVAVTENMKQAELVSVMKKADEKMYLSKREKRKTRTDNK